jgi:hypothetical protein
MAAPRSSENRHPATATGSSLKVDTTSTPTKQLPRKASERELRAELLLRNKKSFDTKDFGELPPSDRMKSPRGNLERTFSQTSLEMHATSTSSSAAPRLSDLEMHRLVAESL